MERRILVPLDGSPLAERALPCAVMLASEMPAELVLFQAVSVPFDYADEERNSLLGRLEAAASEYLAQVAGKLDQNGLGVSQVVERGPAAESIVDYGADTQLIVMATHGRTGANRWARGSVAERVLQGSSTPVLMICALQSPQRADSMRCKSILVPLDGSPPAEQVLPPVVSIAKALDSKITLLRISIIQTSGEFQGDLMMPLEGNTQTADGIAQEYLDQVASRLAGEGVQVFTAVRRGAVAETIVDYSQDHQVDLIAMCTHGQTGLGRWALGRVSDRVLRSGCRLLLLTRAR
jgi:nucleotide-binding universal stress UspA family protein